MSDALTDILESVRMRGSVFSRASLHAPWGIESGDLGRGIFHAVVRGRAYVQLVAGGDPIVLERGDVVLMPFGHNHLLADEPARQTRLLRDLNSVDADGMGHLVVEGEGAHTSLICGEVIFDGGEAHPVFSMLPPLIRVRDIDGSMAPVVETLVELIASEVDSHGPGADAVVARLTDVLVIYVLRDYINRLPADEVGWLGALRDVEIRMALGLMHSRPDQAWTVDELARAVGMSRSSFFSRFKGLVGEPPLQYLTRWRV
ncbi:MAG: AraC family transcriptional regulator, partial [Acidimicrobiia bacterium]|nr:AraC family transcriptional regulator [Acidimicrobiia bacterium]